MKLNQTIDAEQLAEWIDLYQDQLFRYAFFRIGSKEDAEDVVQDAFLKIAATTAHIANPRAYLFRMVGNGCVDVIRNKVKFSPIEERMTTPSPSDEREEQEEFEAGTEFWVDSEEPVLTRPFRYLRFKGLTDWAGTPNYNIGRLAEIDLYGKEVNQNQ